MDLFTQRNIDKQLKKTADEYVQELGVSYADALRMAAGQMDGAGEMDNGVVSSVQTCYGSDGRRIPGVTGYNDVFERLDESVIDYDQRWAAAEDNSDEAAQWLREHVGKGRRR